MNEQIDFVWSIRSSLSECDLKVVLGLVYFRIKHESNGPQTMLLSFIDFRSVRILGQPLMSVGGWSGLRSGKSGLRSCHEIHEKI